MKTFTVVFAFLTLAFSFAQESVTFYFDFNKSELKKDQLEELDNWIKLNADSKILSITGAADEKGSESYNDTLSQKRVDFVIEQINGKVNYREDFRSLALGEKDSKSDLDAENRRVDVYFLPKEYLFLEEDIVNSFLIQKKIDNVAIVDFESQHVSAELSLEQQIELVSSGVVFTLRNIQFDFDSARLLLSSERELEKWLDVLLKNKAIEIVIFGHICCVPRDDSNLSLKRAQAVKEYFVKGGVEKERLACLGFGSSKPKFRIPEKNGYEALQNRRVEILILEK
ncbi:OmpA family protein [Flavobacterium chuncheonense]|uniref:OmpA family protein n=1 Tax=Flavobacterium chuncheonense TaxID=2026653 RepID=A0ABW5YRB3_9FLAO